MRFLRRGEGGGGGGRIRRMRTEAGIRRARRGIRGFRLALGGEEGREMNMM